MIYIYDVEKEKYDMFVSFGSFSSCFLKKMIVEMRYLDILFQNAESLFF